jgi:ATP-dependent Clp protease ATP-binding subunit ClpX
MVRINTKNILFIVAGAFVGLDKIVARSLTKESSMGINSKTLVNKVKFDAELLKKVEPEHLITFGLIPELVGRLPIIMGLEDLTEAQLVRILTEPKNALVRQYVAMFKLDGIDLEFDPETLYEIAKIAKKNKTGGRGLRGVIESKLRKTQFNLPDYRKAGAHKIVVHPETITQDAGPEIFY